MPLIWLIVQAYYKQLAFSYQALLPSQIMAILSMFYYCIITPVFKVNRVFNKEISWVHFSCRKYKRHGSNSYPAHSIFGRWFRSRLRRSNSNDARYLSQWKSKKVLYLRKDKCKLWSIVDLPSVGREVTKKYGQWFWSTGCRCRITRICFLWLAETWLKRFVARGEFELSRWCSMCSRHTSLLLRDTKISLFSTHLHADKRSYRCFKSPWRNIGNFKKHSRVWLF